MKKILPICTSVVLLGLPLSSLAKPVTFTTELKDYHGNNAYLAIYLTNDQGVYQQTLWVSGGMKRYYNQLRGWAQASRLQYAEYDGRTGASVPSGQSYTLTLNIDDTLIDSGYQIHIDSAVEHNRPGRDDVVVELSSAAMGKTIAGTTYIHSFTYKF